MKLFYAFPVSAVLLTGFASTGCRSGAGQLARDAEPPSTVLAESPPAVASAGGQSFDSITPAQFHAPAAEEDLKSAPAPLPGVEPPEVIEGVAAGPTVTPQPVEELVTLALAVHPRIAAAAARVAAAAQRAPQAEALADPTLNNNFYPISDQALQTAGGRAGNTMSLTQAYPWPEKRWTRARIADRETRIAAARLAQVQLEIEESVRLAYYELWFADQAIRITQENRQIGAELISLAEARNRAGGSQQDVLRAQLQLDAIDERLIELRRQKAVAQADLAALVQRPEMINLEPTDSIDVDDVPARLEALFAAAEQCSPRLRERMWTVAREREERRLAELNQYPDFMLGAGWQTMTESDALSGVANGHDNVSFMAGLTLPIWRQRINASIREASAEVAAAARDMDDAQNDVYRQLRRLNEQALAADTQLQLYEQRILPRTRQALQLAAADYRGQLLGFAEVTDNFTELLMFELQAARAKATLAGVLAQIDRVIGCEVNASEESAGL